MKRVLVLGLISLLALVGGVATVSASAESDVLFLSDSGLNTDWTT